MIMTRRDAEIINLLERFKCGTRPLIADILFQFKSGQNVCVKRLSKLIKHKALKRERTYINEQYVYFPPGSKTKQVRHKLLILETFAKLSKMEGIELYEFHPEYTIKHDDVVIRPDGYFVVKHGNKEKHYWLEIHISHNKFDNEKYQKLWEVYKSKGEKIFPKLLVVTDQKGTKLDGPFKGHVLGCDLSNLEEIIKG